MGVNGCVANMGIWAANMLTKLKKRRKLVSGKNVNILEILEYYCCKLIVLRVAT